MSEVSLFRCCMHFYEPRPGVVCRGGMNKHLQSGKFVRVHNAIGAVNRQVQIASSPGCRGLTAGAVKWSVLKYVMFHVTS